MNYVMGDFGFLDNIIKKTSEINQSVGKAVISAGQFVYNAGSMAVDSIKPSLNKVATYHIKPTAKPVVKPAPKPATPVKPFPIISPIAPEKKSISTDLLIGGVAVAALGAYFVMKD